MCKYFTGTTPFQLRVGTGPGEDVDPTSWATLNISLSTVFQVVVFICLGAMADYGGMRKV
jgi:MFS-type transporter involved in bile tolerance (Atg22 family)